VEAVVGTAVMVGAEVEAEDVGVVDEAADEEDMGEVGVVDMVVVEAAGTVAAVVDGNLRPCCAAEPFWSRVLPLLLLYLRRCCVIVELL